MGKVIAVINRKGGVGKTTTSVSLAHGLARKVAGSGGRVLIVDLDPQGHVSRALGVKPNGADLARLLLGEQTVKQAIVSADRESSGGPSRPNLYIIPTSDELAEAKVQIMAVNIAKQFTKGGSASMDDLLENKLGMLRTAFSYIIIDCPPSLDMLERAVYKFADEVIVPVKVDYLGIAGTVQHTDNIVAAQVSGINIKIAMVVPTFVHPRETMDKQVIATLVKQYSRGRVAKPILERVSLKHCVADGRTIFEYEPDSIVAQAYDWLAEKVSVSS